MSAIGAIFNRDGTPIDPERMQRLGDALGRCGPDGGTELILGPVGMSYRAFCTTMESHSDAQPIAFPSGHILVADALVFNRAELTDELQENSGQICTDADLISAGLKKFGTDFLPRVVGNFALAWWDALTRTLFLARDTFGIRPLYYFVDDSLLVCASDLEALLDQVPAGLKVDEEYVAGYLAMFPEPQRTPYKRFHSVEPGHVVAVSGRTLEDWRYWRPDPGKEIKYARDSEYEDHLRCLLDEAVGGCLRSDGRPIWACLSGGLDSSSIVCVADKIIERSVGEAARLETFSIIFSQSETADEGRFIRTVEEKRGRIGCHWTESDSSMDFFPPEDEFLCAPSPLHLAPMRSKWLRERMAADSARVLLDGHGGDQVFWSNPDASPQLAELLSRRRLLTLHRQIRTWSLEFRQPYAHILSRQAILPLMPAAVRKAFEPRIELGSWLNSDFARRAHMRERLLLPADPYGLQTVGGRLHSAFIQAAVWLIAAGVYQEKDGIEMRYPLLHRPLVEFSLAVPFEQKLRPGETRSLMRRALRDVLPEKVLRRKGKGIIDEAVTRALLRERVRLARLFEDARICRRGYADPKALRSALRLAIHGRSNNLGSLMSAISIEIWLRSLENRRALRNTGT